MKQLKIILFIVLVLLLIHGVGYAQTTASTKGTQTKPKEPVILLDSVTLSTMQENQMVVFDKAEKELRDSYVKLMEKKNEYVKGVLDAKDKDASKLASDYEHKPNKLIFKIVSEDKK